MIKLYRHVVHRRCHKHYIICFVFLQQTLRLLKIIKRVISFECYITCHNVFFKTTLVWLCFAVDAYSLTCATGNIVNVHIADVRKHWSQMVVAQMLRKKKMALIGNAYVSYIGSHLRSFRHNQCWLINSHVPHCMSDLSGRTTNINIFTGFPSNLESKKNPEKEFTFSSQGKVREFGKILPIRGKSGNCNGPREKVASLWLL